MKLDDYCDAINVDLVVRRYASQNNRWCARFDRCEVKNGSLLSSEYGNGVTPEGAIEDYLKKIAGKRIILDAGTTNRREFTVPERLEP